MQEKMVEIQLGGYLRQFGKSHKFVANKPKDALRALCLQIPAFKRALAIAESKGITFAVYNGKHNVKNVEELGMGVKSVLKIIPVYMGSKRAGLIQTIVGAALIVASFFGAPTLPAGVALLFGGVVQLLTPQTKGLKVGEDDGNKASYAFGGPVNTTAQGNPIGVLYGKREVGGAIISAGIVAEDQS